MKQSDTKPITIPKNSDTIPPKRIYKLKLKSIERGEPSSAPITDEIVIDV
jgi:hypothetical protein